MELITLKKYIDNPSLLDEETLQDIQDMVTQYPWFHTGHMLLLKNLKNISSSKYDIQLKRSAAHVNNRRLLYQLIADIDSTKKTDTTKDISSEETSKKDDMPAEEHTGTTTKTSTIKRSSPDMKKNISERLTFEQQVGDDESDKDIDDVMEPSVESVVDPGYHERNDDETLTIDKNQQITKKKGTDKEDDEKQIDNTPDYGLLDFEYNLENIEKQTEGKQHTSGKLSKKDKLIDKFIKEEPRINSKGQENTNEDFSAESVKENSELFTETLANIYIKQERYSKAIYIYEQLSLKYPQKSAYFAKQIKKVKNYIK